MDLPYDLDDRPMRPHVSAIFHTHSLIPLTVFRQPSTPQRPELDLR